MIVGTADWLLDLKNNKEWDQMINSTMKSPPVEMIIVSIV